MLLHNTLTTATGYDDDNNNNDKLPSTRTIVLPIATYLGELLRLCVQASRHDEGAHVVLVPGLHISCHEHVHVKSATPRCHPTTPPAPSPASATWATPDAGPGMPPMVCLPPTLHVVSASPAGEVDRGCITGKEFLACLKVQLFTTAAVEWYDEASRTTSSVPS